MRRLPLGTELSGRVGWSAGPQWAAWVAGRPGSEAFLGELPSRLLLRLLEENGVGG